MIAAIVITVAVVVVLVLIGRRRARVEPISSVVVEQPAYKGRRWRESKRPWL